MKRKHKTYSKPKRPFDKQRIEEEGEIRKEFGLKNKKEIWKAEAKIKSMREKAKKLIKSPHEKQKKLLTQLQKTGLNVNSIADVLALDKKNYLERRLQTILVRKKICTTPKSARQMITHRKILVDGKIVNIPSYIVPVKFEDKISVKEKKKTQKKIKEQEENEQKRSEERRVGKE